MSDLQDPELQEMRTALLAWLRDQYGEVRYSIGEALARAAAEVPDRAAFVEIDRADLSYADLFSLAQRIVATLNALGYTPASRIALILPTSTQSAVVQICVMAGMTITPLNPAAPADELERNMRRAHVNAVLLLQHETPAAREAAARCEIAVLDLVFAPASPVGIFSIVNAPSAQAEPRFAQPDDTALVLLTSGATAALPKLIPITQATIVIRMLSYHYYMRGPDQVRVNCLPLYHLGGMTLHLIALLSQETYTCTPSADPVLICAYLTRYKVSRILLVPSMLQEFCKLVERDHEAAADLRLQQIDVGSVALSE